MQMEQVMISSQGDTLKKNRKDTDNYCWTCQRCQKMKISADGVYMICNHCGQPRWKFISVPVESNKEINPILVVK